MSSLQQVFDSRKADIISLCDFFQGLTNVVLDTFISALALNLMWVASCNEMPHDPEDNGALNSTH